MNSIVNSSQIRRLNVKKAISWYSGLFKAKPLNPPYEHIVQIGDPRLRAASEPVPLNLIKSMEFKCLLELMKFVMKKYNCVGLSAPQLGVNLNVFLMELHQKHLLEYTEKERTSREMTLIPFTVVINPEWRTTDYSKLSFVEGCESVKGLSADVARFRAVELSGLDGNGAPFTLQARGWHARVIQHEADHLNGVLYTDIMDKKTLHCNCWQVVNERNGRVELPYGA